ncbi:MAG: hypothetical protein ACYDGW_09550 [Vulcanimicrobiaceae bacterium]
MRTTTLLTLEILGGRAHQRDVYRIVPDCPKPTVKNVLTFYVKEGVLSKKGRTVGFSDRCWVPMLRQLLRAVARANPQLTRGIRERLASDRQPRDVDGDHKSGLLAFASFERLLTELALQGPMKWTNLFGRSKADAEMGVATYQRLGIIISRKRGCSRVLSLNAAHPVYKPLRKLLIAMSGRERETLNGDWAEPKAAFGIDRLFLHELRTSVLCTLDACSYTGLDATTMSRLLPQFDRGKIAEALRHYEALGTLRSDRKGQRVIYSFDRYWEYHLELKALLRAINARWPRWKNAARVANRLRPQRGRPKAGKKSRRSKGKAVVSRRRSVAKTRSTPQPKVS